MNRLIYLPLGGAGEIGMNSYVYGYGPKGKERLILVDLGVAFPDMDTSPGVDLMEWKRPVLAGDTLGGHCEVLDARVSRSRPELGIVRMRAEVTNQRGEVVAISEYINMMRLAAKGADHAHG